MRKITSGGGWPAVRYALQKAGQSSGILKFYKALRSRDVILMSAQDIARLGLSVDQRVTVQSKTGQMEAILVREFPIRAGNAAMYFPEANVLVTAAADPESRTPAFKAVSVTVTADTAE